jgi:hypothetical protein
MSYCYTAQLVHGGILRVRACFMLAKVRPPSSPVREREREREREGKREGDKGEKEIIYFKKE